MRVSSHQPAFLPWAGFWHKVLSVDKFVLSEGVQWAKDGFLNRIQHQGAWLTLPVDAKDDMRIGDVRLANDRRRIAKTWKTVAQVSGPYKSRLDPLLEALREVQPGELLASINVRLLAEVGWVLGIEPLCVFEFVREAGDGGSKTDRLNSRVSTVVPEMTSFYMGQGTAGYFDKARFKNVPCFVQNPSGFKDSPSIVQLIANEPDVVDWIMSRGRWVELTR